LTVLYQTHPPKPTKKLQKVHIKEEARKSKMCLSYKGQHTSMVKKQSNAFTQPFASIQQHFNL